MYTFSKKCPVHASREQLFAWHCRSAAFNRLCPPWVTLKDVKRTGDVEDGARVSFKQMQHGIGISWEVEHFGYEKQVQFCDRALKSPFKHYTHKHAFSGDALESLLEDRIEYSLPWFLNSSCLKKYFEKELERLFWYRHKVTKSDVEHHARYSQKPQRIMIAGASGLVGRVLVPFLQAGGHTVDVLERKKGARHFWDPEASILAKKSLEGYDAIINLCGHSIAGHFWTENEKKRILTSRIISTRLLAQTINSLENPPKVFVSASATGLYGNCDDDLIDEERISGEGFLADVCRAWEEEASAVSVSRTVLLRIAMVLSSRGGALGKMAVPFSLGLGGVFGSGKQWMSWISIDDLVRAVHFALCEESCSGAVNLASSAPVQNVEFVKTVGECLHRPVWLHIPEKALRMLPGNFAEETLLVSQRVIPKKLQSLGFVFEHTQLKSALAFEFGVL